MMRKFIEVHHFDLDSLGYLPTPPANDVDEGEREVVVDAKSLKVLCYFI